MDYELKYKSLLLKIHEMKDQYYTELTNYHIQNPINDVHKQLKLQYESKIEILDNIIKFSRKIDERK